MWRFRSMKMEQLAIIATYVDLPTLLVCCRVCKRWRTSLYSLIRERLARCKRSVLVYREGLSYTYWRLFLHEQELERSGQGYDAALCRIQMTSADRSLTILDLKPRDAVNSMYYIEMDEAEVVGVRTHTGKRKRNGLLLPVRPRWA